ncbi:MAG: RcpC/CpaB family pilus assembly protein, partial [Actinomycetota bacterium]|nr:RcpC/CpaB family pilus assembly protein [Actinomycetota bacterium]
LTPDQRAISLTITEAPGNNDVLQAGDRVDVYAQLTKGKNPVVVLLDPNILVVKPSVPSGGAATSAKTAQGGTSSSAASSNGASSNNASTAAAALAGSSLVLAVSSAQAADLIWTANNGSLYLTLRPNGATTSPRGVTTLDTVVRDSVATVNPPRK